MHSTNGFLVHLSRSKTPNFTKALNTMRYRAWNGFEVRESGNIHIGICSTNKYSNIVHGEFYDKIDLKTSDKMITSLSNVDGSYAFAIPYHDSIIFARDALGTKPLYYAKNSSNFLLATDPRALSILGFKPTSVLPGFLYRASLNKIERKKFNTIRYETKRYGLKDAVEKITSLLSKSIRNRIANRKVVLGFGGGIDSTVIAKLAPNLTAVTICTNDSLDYKLGKESAEMLGMNHETVLVNEKNVKDAIGELQQVMRFKNAMHASIACAVHLLAKYVKEKKMDALMLGQLADELFGGYARYVRYLKISEKKVRDEMFNDVRNAYVDNFERDELASSFYTDLLLPYAALDFAKFAVTLPLNMKLDKSGARKIILREAAKNLAIPDALVYREKKAMQFSSGIYKIVSKLSP
ncbi:MAG: asparagine synthetase B [Nitrososphaerales archaeon]